MIYRGKRKKKRKRKWLKGVNYGGLITKFAIHKLEIHTNLFYVQIWDKSLNTRRANHEYFMQVCRLETQEGKLSCLRYKNQFEEVRQKKFQLFRLFVLFTEKGTSTLGRHSNIFHLIYSKLSIIQKTPHCYIQNKIKFDIISKMCVYI